MRTNLNPGKMNDLFLMGASVAFATDSKWITVKFYMFIGKIHCVSRIGMIPQYIYIYIYMVLFGWFLSNINHCVLFNAISSLYIYTKHILFVGYLMSDPLYTSILNIWFALVGFYGILTIAGYLMSDPLYTCTLNIYDLLWLDFMSY